jgi:glycosyltransferase involved in cell wall biosynthesis
MIVAKSRGLRVYVRDEATGISAARSPFKTFLKRSFFWFLNQLCDGFLAVGTLNAEYYVQNGIPRDKIFLVPYCVDNEYFEKRADLPESEIAGLRGKLGLTRDLPVILFASKLQERKKAQDLLEAFARVVKERGAAASAYLIIIGDGEMRASLEATVRAEGLSELVRFEGFKNQSELPVYFKLCDVFVLPSVREPWGLVVNEAMTAGKAVIVSDQVGSAPDLVHDGENGFVFRAGDVADLHGVLLRVVEDREMLRRMGNKSRELIHRWSYREDLDGLKRALRV